MKNYYILNYNDQFINKNINCFTNRPSEWSTKKMDPQTTISASGLKFLEHIGVNISVINFFIGPPNYSTDIHMDGPYPSYALNYMWGESNSTMRWFKKLNIDSSGSSQKTTDNTEYSRFESDEVELIEEVTVPVKTLMLVRINIPHQVINGSNRRYCISVRCNPFLGWEYVPEYFQKHILE
jgi:hypothetical protein